MNGSWTSRRLLLIAAFVLLVEGVVEVALSLGDAMPKAIREHSWDRLFESLYVRSLAPVLVGLTIALVARLPRRLGIAAAAMGTISAVASLVGDVWVIRLLIRESTLSAWQIVQPVQTTALAVAVLILAVAVLRAAGASAAG